MPWSFWVLLQADGTFTLIQRSWWFDRNAPIGSNIWMLEKVCQEGFFFFFWGFKEPIPFLVSSSPCFVLVDQNEALSYSFSTFSACCHTSHHNLHELTLWNYKLPTASFSINCLGCVCFVPAIDKLVGQRVYCWVFSFWIFPMRLFRRKSLGGLYVNITKYGGHSYGNSPFSVFPTLQCTFLCAVYTSIHQAFTECLPCTRLIV